ncbi:flavin prenyltransferase UbiX [Sulfodiicoccus acidiphilus]|uniref:Flavin prenyltransferase UbiX n=1 Tax=Sulfodiicoccus acidiphilus TaxID=1670455 RepID=A0A348B1T3_9CREN|nr:flavin prenyltransferase UbiX [Sulfodiicoccus acidiphilus]GGT94726.1 flavin prenyltransferase UbiX [Sulfodiicoccus acidiphilus]
MVGVTGGSGPIYAVRLLEELKKRDVETHLILSPSAALTIKLETDYTVDYVESLASRKYNFRDVSAAISSGSFRTDGMVIIPCSMKTLAGVASGYSDNLVLRAADVTLKERRPLVLVVRETPYNLIHIRNMYIAARAGAIIMPASPAFYHRPTTMQQLVDQVVGRVLDMFGVEHNLYRKWSGPQAGDKDVGE